METQEIVYFQCDKKLKTDFYKMAQDKQYSPGSLLRAFMRKAIKNYEDEKIKKNKLPPEYDYESEN